MVIAMKEKNKLNVVRVKLVEDIPLYSDEIVGCADDAVDILKKELSTYDREVFGIINLDTKNKVLNFNIVSVGTLNSSAAHPRETFKTAILSNSASFIAIHNHPSGFPSPSPEDLLTTQRLYEAGEIIGIEMLDHIIVAENKIFSFAENNLLGKTFKEAKLMLGMNDNTIEYRKNNFRNNGTTYTVIARNNNDALLQNQSTNAYVIAKSINPVNNEWDQGKYYGNTEKDLAIASFDFALETDKTFAENILARISYKELFYGVANIENDRWCELTEEQKEAVYERYMNSDKYTSILDQYLLEQLDEYIEDALNFKEEVNTDNLLLNKNDKEMEFKEGVGMIYKHEDGTINTFYQKGETVEYPNDEEIIEYIDNAESWDAVDEEVYEELCKRLGIDSSKFDDPDNLFIEIQTQFIYNKCKLDWWQKGEVREDFENGLTFEQVKLYAKPEFDCGQIINIRSGLEAGLSKEQVQLYAKPEFGSWQMAQIRKGFENGLSDEQVQFYAKQEFEYWQMEEIRVGFQNGLTFEQVELYAKPEFNSLHMDRIRRGLEDGLTFEEVMTKINNGFGQGFTKGYLIRGDFDGEKYHRNRESFFESREYDFTKLDDTEGYHPDHLGVRNIKILNSDITGTNDYSIVIITRDNEALCDREMDGQWSDGIFENCNVSLYEPLSPEKTEYYIKRFKEHFNDTLSNEKSKGLNPIEKAMEIARDKTEPKEINNEGFDFEL